MPLTPTLPVNKNTLDKRIEVNLPINNGQQLITAQKLQETLTPIVNSTYGLKTIWAGNMYLSYATNGSRDDFATNEIYYDPYYFPPVQDPGGALILDSVLNKYQVVSKGSGLRVNNLPDGSFTNISAALVTSNGSEAKYGGGLTFDGTITSGILSGLTVNNPGTGYRAGSTINTYLELQLDVIGGGTKPQLKFNLYNTIYPANATSGNQNGWGTSTTNVFIPNIANIFPFPPAPTRWIPNIQMYFSDIYGGELISGRSLSRGGRALSDNVSTYSTTGNVTTLKPGFYFTPATAWVNGTASAGLINVEIKVPIIYQPTVI
jgi:hypothetical protein